MATLILLCLVGAALLVAAVLLAGCIHQARIGPTTTRAELRADIDEDTR